MDKDRQLLPSMNGDADLPEQLWAYDDFLAHEDQPATDYAAGLTSLGFLRAALRRCTWLWCVTALAGFVGGLGVAVVLPPSYQASTSVLLTHSPVDNPVDAMQTDAALAESHSVAAQAMNKLGLREDVSSFIATYTVTPVTDRVLLIKFSAPSASAAIVRATTLATVFLQFRADQMQTQQELVVAGLNQQIAQARQHVASLGAQISKLSSGTQQSELSQLTTQHTQAVTALTALQQTASANQASTQATTTLEIKDSRVLDAASAIHHSALKYDLMYAAMGLFGGLAVGVAIIVIRALVSDRLRRRDDIADALGASVSISAGPIGTSRWFPSWPGRKAAQANDMQRLVTHLRDAVPESLSGTACLALVPVDNEKVAARSLMSLAMSCAQQGQRVLVADLCPRAPAGHLVGAGKAGVQTVTVDGTNLVVMVPSRDEVVPVGPVRPHGLRTPGGPADDALAAAYDSADILLTLMALDPSIGGEHLRTWAGSAVAIITAGRSTWVRIHAVGEMIRLARTPLVSAILVGADKTDESLGMIQTAARRSPAAPVNRL
jgi:capsular polysaccharide biosynthesis protein